MNNKKLANFHCGLCSRRGVCEDLCPPIAWSVRQVETTQREKPKRVENSIPARFPDSLSTSEIIFKMFFFEHKSQSDISHHLSVSRPYVCKEIKKQMRLVAENLRESMKKSPA